MATQFFKIKTNAPASSEVKVLVIYTGGTFGMIYDTRKKSLVPYDFDLVLERLPEIQRLDFEIYVTTLRDIVDSSNMQPKLWVEIARIIYNHYHSFDSFVVIHGTDTMAYTASALSFMLEGLNKPVIFTGAQLPIGAARTDAKENLITALEIAASQLDGRPLVPEVSLFFGSTLLRGNRSSKKESSQFAAFRSENYPVLAEAGVTIEYNFPFIKLYDESASLQLHQRFSDDVVILKLFPGISEKVIRSVLQTEDLKGVVLETYGSGNAPTHSWFLDALKEAIDRNVLMYNVSQCDGGRVTQGYYQTSSWLKKVGVISGSDLTTEAAITKMMFAFGQSDDVAEVRAFLETPICGEMTI
ncbi:MAG: asparaginase [Spirosomataceae bacterium]